MSGKITTKGIIIPNATADDILTGDGGLFNTSENITTTVSKKTANYTLLLTDGTVIVDTTTGDVTISLPSALSAFTNNKGKIFSIKRNPIDVSSNVLTVDAFGAEKIDNELTQTIPFASCMTIQSDGLAWYII